MTNSLVAVKAYVIHILKPMQNAGKASRAYAKDSQTDTSDSVLVEMG
jgi:hypothetical protein